MELVLIIDKMVIMLQSQAIGRSNLNGSIVDPTRQFFNRRMPCESNTCFFHQNDCIEDNDPLKGKEM